MELLHCSCTGSGWLCSCPSRAGGSHHELAHPALNCILLTLVYSQTHEPHTVVFDLSDTKTVVNAAEEILRALGHVDILINNAGISFRGTIVDTGLDVDKKVMETNYFGPIAFTKGTCDPQDLADASAELSTASLVFVISPGRTEGEGRFGVMGRLRA